MTKDKDIDGIWRHFWGTWGGEDGIDQEPAAVCAAIELLTREVARLADVTAARGFATERLWSELPALLEEIGKKAAS